MYRFIIPLFALAFLLVSCSPTGAPTTPVPSSSSSARSTAAVSFDGKILTRKHTVILHTSMGDITLVLDADAAPKTVTNFIDLAKGGYYDHLTFHRVIPDFMIQGGDPNGDGTGGSSIFGPTFEDEISAKSYGLDKETMAQATQDPTLAPDIASMTVEQYLENTKGYTYNDSLQSLPMIRGAIAMANRGANTNGSQFFIIQKKDGTPWLNGQHTVFGNVTKGLDVVDSIAAVPADQTNNPLRPVSFTVEVVN